MLVPCNAITPPSAFFEYLGKKGLERKQGKKKTNKLNPAL